ncbi:hypothetical protein BASA81_016978 [Batrachochytrium salamandrivorans]|nr:hypothetical protein BASA81_016978 [Batrachochytrium salamandrivorans]
MNAPTLDSGDEPDYSIHRYLRFSLESSIRLIINCLRRGGLVSQMYILRFRKALGELGLVWKQFGFGFYAARRQRVIPVFNGHPWCSLSAPTVRDFFTVPVLHVTTCGSLLSVLYNCPFQV